MPDPRERPLRFRPRGVCDTIDGTNSPPGACASLANLIFDPGTPGILACRPANLELTSALGQSAIAVGSEPLGMALTPDGSKLFVCNYGAGTVSVISTATNTVIETVSVGNGPTAVAITPDGTKAYVTNYISGTVTQIVISGYATTTITSTTLSSPAGIAITPDGTTAYIVNRGNGTLSVLTVASATISATPIVLTGAMAAIYIVINAAQTIAYVTDFEAAVLFAVTLSGSTVVSYPVSAVGTTSPALLAISPDGSTIYIADQLTFNAYVFSTVSNTVVNTILLPFVPAGGVAINATASSVYFLNDAAGEIIEYDTATGQQTAVEFTSVAPDAILVTALGIYVADSGSAAVDVLAFANVVTAAFVLGDIVFGLIGSATSAGVDTPFAYNIVANTFFTVNGVTATNVPASQATSGAWTPPDMDMVGERIFVTHIGFNYSAGFAFGFFDISSFSDTTTLNTTSASKILTGNPNIQGLAPGYLITATGVPAGTYVTNYAAVNISFTASTHSNTTVDSIVPNTTGMAAGQIIAGPGIPPNTIISSVNSSSAITISNAATATGTGVALTASGATITMSANATGTHSQESATIVGGTPTNPLWCAGNTTGATQLTGVATCVKGFNNRAYFGQGNNLIMTDTLSVNVSNVAGVQVLTVGDSTPITKIGGLTEYQSTGGILQALVAFKANFLQQITGDPATGNLAQNSLTGYPGTSAPRSVATGTNGLFYMANDGVRTISQIGQVSDPDPDLAVPFIYAVQPSRVAAAFNSDIYRICTQNGNPNVPGDPYQGYYYDQKRKAWNGPHSFRDDLLVAYGNDFLSFNNSIPGTMWQSFSVQGHENEGNTFIENGAQLTWDYQTSPMSEENNMYANCLVRSTLDISYPATGDQYQFQAADAARGALATAQVTAPDSAAVWDAFDWGDGTLWGAKQQGLGPRDVPWTQPPVFNKLVLSASGNSSLDLRLGAWYNGFEKLNFIMQ